MDPITKEMVFKYFAGQTSTLQTHIIQAWIEDPANENLYYSWLEEFEKANLQYIPDYAAAYQKFDQIMQSNTLSMGSSSSESHPEKSSFFTFKRVLGIAASLLFIISTFAFQSRILYKTYSTGPGQLSKITLPDSSEVILNTNSSLRVPRFFEYKEIRSAYLEGNAKFKIKHTRDERLFVVKSGGNFQIQVLGTEFDVYSGKDSSRVFLKSGSIRLISRDKDEIKTIVVKPREVVKFVENKVPVVEKDQDFWQFEAWEERQFKFDATSMAEVAEILEKQFGYQVIFEDADIAEKVVSGGFSWNSEHEILYILSKLLGFEIESQGITYKLKNKKN